MKKIFYILILLSLLVCNSCDKNLDINISDELDVNYFGSEYRITMGVGAAYAAITNIYTPDLQRGTKHGFWLLPGDDITTDGSYNALEAFSGLNADNKVISNMWNEYYDIISRCNFMLEMIDNKSLDAVYKTEGLREANKAELLFIKSWCYFKLWDNWNKAPLQKRRITSVSTSSLPPSEGFELIDDAISSLEEVAPLAKEMWDNSNIGRINRDACYGLLIKLYVTRACYNSKNVMDYGKAITAYNKISSSRLASFKNVPYGDNFDYHTENNPESLFEFQASIQAGQTSSQWINNDFGATTSFYHYNDGHWSNYNCGVFGPSQKLIDAFDMEDPRRSETFKGNEVENFGGAFWWIYPNWSKFGNHQLVKYTNGERGNVLDPIWQIGSNNNPRLIRMADVKLCVAEAYLATGNSGAALIQVNDVRERARNSVAPASASPAALGSVTMADIMKERFLELAGEDGHRWSDLKRWHAAGYINLASWTAADFGFGFDAGFFKFDVTKHLLFPIPKEEINRNPLMAASGQNPGY